MKLFKIAFDNPNESYFAGQVITGNILIHLNRPKKIKALKLRWVGRAETHWIERSGKTSNSYGAKELYFWIDQVLIGEGNQDIVLSTGENAFSFRFPLPGGIPSSFQGAHGHVQYFLKATITRPWKFAQKVSSYFTVNGFLDLNLFGHASRALTVSKSSTVSGWFCCTTSGVGFMLKLVKTGFVPGDTVRFSIQIENPSSQRISAVVMTLSQVTTYKDEGGRREKCERKVVNELRGPSVRAKSTKVWDSEASQSIFKIPAVPPTNLGVGGSIISVQYYLCVSLKLSKFFETTVEGKVQLIIGTVPYRNLFEELMPASYHAQRQPPVVIPLETADEPPPMSETVAPRVTPLDFNSPPPTYAEAMELYNRYGSTFPSPSAPMLPDTPENASVFGEDDEAGDGRPFNPRYATYEWDRNNRSS